MVSNRWKQWTDHYARSGDWPKIRTMRTTKAKLIDDLEEVKGDPLIKPFVGHSVDNTIAEAKEELSYLDQVLKRAPIRDFIITMGDVRQILTGLTTEELWKRLDQLNASKAGRLTRDMILEELKHRHAPERRRAP